MNFPMELSLEQQFKLKVYGEQVKELTSEESQAYLLEVMRQLMIKENVIKHLAKQVA
ncbi:MAG: NblA/ycf18 family protein [Cyanobacteria bacterium P01_C01_bin.120]